MEFSLIWIYFFLSLLVGMFLLVPKKEIINLLPFGLIGGFIVALVVQYLAINIFSWWKFNAALISWANIPLGILAAWVPPVIIFGYYFPRIKFNWGLVAAFVVGATVIEYLFVATGYRDYINWNIYLTLGLGLIIHLGLAGYLLFRNRLRS